MLYIFRIKKTFGIFVYFEIDKYACFEIRVRADMGYNTGFESKNTILTGKY